MTFELEHFKQFHDDPASFSDEDFRTKVLEWMIFVRETQGQFDFESEEWDDIFDRFYDELDSRFPKTPELEAQYAEIKSRITELVGKDEQGFIRAMTDLRDFVKRYQVEFQFADRYVAEVNADLQEILAMRQEIVLQDYIIKGLEYEREQAIIALDEALADFYEMNKKIPVTTALRGRKRHKGN